MTVAFIVSLVSTVLFSHCFVQVWLDNTVYFMSFYIDSTERTCRTQVFARPTSNTTFSVDRRDFRRVGIWSLTRHHRKLLYILILHQTTTDFTKFYQHEKLLYILILHQTTTLMLLRSDVAALLYILILHQTTTRLGITSKDGMLLYILILHQTTTFRCRKYLPLCCFISWFYIKPQQRRRQKCYIRVALYLDSTSNHNYSTRINEISELLYILILHQTTTTPLWWTRTARLLYILILHQTTTWRCYYFSI